MLAAWRIVKENRAESAFSGEGAAWAGGRWNSEGIPVVYTSAHKSLAVLELLVHLTPQSRIRFKSFRIEFSEDLVEYLPADALPEDWRSEPPGPSTMRVGDQWVAKSLSAILAVPSTIVPEELNFILNTNHPAFKRIRIEAPTDFAFDARLTPARGISRYKVPEAERRPG